MHVIATAGHVDHGKSTLIRALTGVDPDRLAEEHRRGLSISLGYCWTRLPGVGEVAFVDVPGHERFISTTLAGLGPAPAALLVVAADDPWMPQAAEHLAALDALGVSHGVVAITRADLADPAPAAARARAEVEATTLRGAPIVTVSGHTGDGLDDLRDALTDLVSRLPEPDPDADVRLWVDRRFGIAGAGTVVTGTLPAGRIRTGDVLSDGTHRVRVRGIQALGTDCDVVTGVARVALNLGGRAPDTLDRGHPLTTPDAWAWTSSIDVAIRTSEAVPQQPVLYVGAATVATHARPLGAGLLRLRLERPLPLHVGDRALLRDPGDRRLWGVLVLDPEPPELRRRGAARRRAAELAGEDGTPDVGREVRRRRFITRDRLHRLGVPATADADIIECGQWLLARSQVARWRRHLQEMIAEHNSADPLDPGVPVPAVSRGLGLPSPDVLPALIEPPLRAQHGRVHLDTQPDLPAALREALDTLRAEFAQNPFAAPDAERLAQLGLDTKELAAAERAGELIRVGATVLPPDADTLAIDRLGALAQPFTTSEARRALETSRRVAIPLLERLDRLGLTHRLPDDTREVVKV